MIRFIPVFFFIAWFGITYMIHHDDVLSYPTLYNGWFEPAMMGFIMAMLLTFVCSVAVSVLIYGDSIL